MAGAGLYFALGTGDDERPQALDEEERIAPTTVADPSPSPSDVAASSPEAEDRGHAAAVLLRHRHMDVRRARERRSRRRRGHTPAVRRGSGERPRARRGRVRRVRQRTLADSRSWTAGGAWRFQQVAEGAGADFTVYLASPEQRAVLCGSQNTTVSCRNGDNVVINSARWITGVEHWDGTLETYRQYAVNHEVGHRLGHGHEVCPERGATSPVMAQQTYQLAGLRRQRLALPRPHDVRLGTRSATTTARICRRTTSSTAEAPASVPGI